MASLSTEPNGRKRTQFIDGNGSRKALRLGVVTMKQAEAFKVKLESLIGARITGGNVADEVTRWLADLPDDVYATLAGVGLVKARKGRAFKLADLFREFFASLTLKPGTRTTYEQTRRRLVDYFGENKPLCDIGPLDAEQWRQWMRTNEKLCDATVSKRVKTARQAFRRAGQWKMLTENPFEG